MRLRPKSSSSSSSSSHHHYYIAKLKKHYKWILWLSFSIYLFLTTTFSSTPFSLQTKFHIKSPITKVISDSTTTTILSSSPSPLIYIYELPPHLNRDWLDADPRCGSHLFAAEVAIHEALLGYGGRVVDPEMADFFFVPVYVSCNFSTANGFPSLSHALPMLAEAVRLVSARFPYWNRSAGRDHVFVASHDYGACFHPMEDVAIADGIPEFLKNSVLLQTFGVKQPHVCQDVEHVQIPPHVPAEVADELPHPETARRDIFAFFRGKMEVHPKNISGRFYSRKVRTEILKRYGKNKKFYLRRKRFDGYRSEIARSVFCLCPLGWAPWSPRLVESVLLGCVPVIIADDIRLPFPDAIRWPEISLTVAEKEIGSLERILDHVAATNLSTIHKNLWDPAKRKALVFNRRMQEGDATWQVLRELEGKLDRSWRRRKQVEAWR